MDPSHPLTDIEPAAPVLPPPHTPYAIPHHNTAPRRHPVIILILASILLLSLIFASVYSFQFFFKANTTKSNTPSELTAPSAPTAITLPDTEIWKSYSDNPHFTLSLPPNTKITAGTSGDTTNFRDWGNNWLIQITLMTNPSRLRSDRLINQTRSSFLNSCPVGYDATPVGDTHLNESLITRSFSVAYCPSGYYFFHFLNIQKDTYEIRQYFAYDSSRGITSLGQFEDTTKQILSTLRFSNNPSLTPPTTQPK